MRTDDGEQWRDVPLEEIDLPSFLGRSSTSSEERLAAVMDGARAVREDRDRRQATELAAVEARRRRDARRRRALQVLVGAVVVVVVIGAGLALRQNPTVTAAVDDLRASRSADDPAPTSVTPSTTTAPRPATTSTTAAPAPTTEPTVPLAPRGNRPTPQRNGSTTPLGVPAPVVGDGPHAFAGVGADGRPAAFDPCRPIAVVVNPRLAPPDADALLDSALAEMSRTTGLQFVREGTTDEEASLDRVPYQPDRYGNRWAPVLISWSDEVVNPELAGDPAGYGGNTWFETEGHLVTVTGAVALDSAELAQIAGWYGPAAVRALLLHELGHVVGLDHVDDPSQVMFGGPAVANEFGVGDLAGLAVLGSGPCTKRL